MPKAKLKISAKDANKLEQAADWHEVKVGDARKVGDQLAAEVTYRTPQQLFELGRSIDSMPDAPVKKEETKATPKK